MRKHVLCETCGHTYEYTLRRSATGSHYGFTLTPAEQAQKEAEDAAAKLKVELETGCDVKPCPKCGALTAAMRAERSRLIGIYVGIAFGSAGFWALLYNFSSREGWWYVGLTILSGGIFALSLLCLACEAFGSGKKGAKPGSAIAAPKPASTTDQMTELDEAFPAIDSEETEKFFAAVAQAIESEEDGPKRPVLYMLQFNVLPEAAFQNHPELLHELSGKGSIMPLSYFRATAYMRCIETGWISPEGHSEEAYLKSEVEMFKALTTHQYQCNGMTVHVLTMPTPETPPEAHFIAIVHRDGEPKNHGSPAPSTRYFTLEKVSGRSRFYAKPVAMAPARITVRARRQTGPHLVRRSRSWSRANDVARGSLTPATHGCGIPVRSFVSSNPTNATIDDCTNSI